jgi:predicted RNase H-like HicB family nuclease
MIVQTSPFKPGTSQQLSYPVVVGRKSGDRWMARLLGWSECWAEGTTREEALSRLEQRLLEQFVDMEVMQLNISIPQPENPLLKLAGKYKDDPDWEDMGAAIAQYRQAIDAELSLEWMDAEGSHEVA